MYSSSNCAGLFQAARESHMVKCSNQTSETTCSCVTEKNSKGMCNR